MSAQLRFRTLVKHAGSIYDAAKEARTGLLMSSLDDIVEKINPQGAADWHKVRHDTQRVLRVWLSREQTHAAQMLADQLMDSLAEFSEAPAVVAAAAAPVALPRLEIEEKPVAVASAPVPVATLLTNPVVADDEEEDEDEELEGEEDEVLVASDDEDEEVDDDDDEEGDGEKAPAAAAPENDDEGEAEDDEEVLEPEAEADAADATPEDEEEGMEVEKRTIRGRDYWIDVNTNKLYAVVDDDDVGDEVGAIVNGRPVFLSA